MSAPIVPARPPADQPVEGAGRFITIVGPPGSLERGRALINAQQARGSAANRNPCRFPNERCEHECFVPPEDPTLHVVDPLDDPSLRDKTVVRRLAHERLLRCAGRAP